MKKRKKYPKLPNGYGSIKYLGKGRRNPYGVYPPTTDYNDDGIPITPQAICYTDAWMKGFTVLTAYRAGNYYTGYELTLNLDDTGDLDTICQKILSDYQQTRSANEKNKESRLTFSQVYEKFYDWKYTRISGKQYSRSTIDCTRAAYKNSSPLHNKMFIDLRYRDLQDVIDKSTLKYASLEQVISLWHQMYSYAINILLITDRDHAASVKIGKPDDEEHGEPFTSDELNILWENKDDPIVEFLLIMCYSGFRISAYKTMEVNLDELYFQGGVKNKYSKNRIVPIHSAIIPLVKKRLNRDKALLTTSPITFRKLMYPKLEELKISNHTPHDCRHTFSKLCEDSGVRENDRKRMLGHSFGNDITNRVYGHRELEDLRIELEKIIVNKICC